MKLLLNVVLECEFYAPKTLEQKQMYMKLKNLKTFLTAK